MEIMKLSIEEIEGVLLEKKLEPKIVQDIVKTLHAVVEENKHLNAIDPDKAPKGKNQFLIVVSDPEGKLQNSGVDLVGYVAQMKKDDDASTLLHRISEAAREFNESKKGQKNPITTLCEGIAFLKRKFLKAQDVLIKTQEPVRIITTDNKLV